MHRYVVSLVDGAEDVVDLRTDALRRDPVLLVVAPLQLPAPPGDVETGPDRGGFLIGVHDHLSRDVAGGPAARLDEGALGAEETLLVGVQDRHERHLGDVQPFPQEIDADEAVELAHPKIADDLHPLQGVDVRMEVLHPDAEVPVVGGQVLRHPLRQRRHQDPLAAFGPRPDLSQKVVHLAGHRLHDDLRVHQARRPDDLLHDMTGGPAHLEDRRRRRNIDPLVVEGIELIEAKRPVVEGRGEPETVVDQSFFPRPVAPVHPDELGDRRMALVDEDQGAGGKVFHQRRGRLAGLPPGQVAGIVLDPLAVAHLLHHLDVEAGPLLEALGLQELVFRVQFPEPFS